MSSKPVISKVRRRDHSIRDFTFSEEMVPFIRDESSPQFIRDYYTQAWDSFKQQRLPNTTDEAWRRTDIRSLGVSNFRLGFSGEGISRTSIPDQLLEPLIADQHGGQIVLDHDRSSINLEQDLKNKGVIFTDLRSAVEEYPEQLEKIIGRVVEASEGKFSALSAAFSDQGILLYVPPGLHVTEPLNSVFWGSGIGKGYLSHILVYVDDGASITYLHETASPNYGEGQVLHSGIVELFVGQNADLKFVELQSWGDNVWNFSHERARVERDGRLDWIFGAVGSRLTKNFSDIDLTGPGAVGRMSGFYFTQTGQHYDHDTQQNHLAPNTSSDLLFKGALKGKSRSVWQGMIYVAPGAQKTDGYQANRNLVLSKEARADSIPGLEILADDVRCTHGATVGKIDDDQVFYLRSRGIPYDDAERLIVAGFFDPIMQRIPFEGVRTRFQNAIVEKME